MRGALRIAALTTAGAAVLWAASIALTGGFEFSLAGVRVTNHETVRPLAWAAAAFALFVYLHGVAPTVHTARALTSRVSAWWLAVLVAGVVLAAGVTFATTVASGADAYGYVSQADLWIDGRLVLEQRWAAALPWRNAPDAFAPLGYASTGNGARVVPTYSPGLPLLMAAAKLVGGQAALFWVVPLCGCVLVLATYGIGRRLDAPPWAALTAAWLMATSPVFAFMIVLPMSDVPTAAAWAAAWYFALASSTERTAPIRAGACAALAVAIRPNLVPLTLPLAWACVIASDARHGATSSSFATRTLRFALGFAPGPLLVAAVNTRLYGSPLQSGYGNLDRLFAIENIWPNIRIYGTWILETETPMAVVGLVALITGVEHFWPSSGARRAARAGALFVAGLWAVYLPYLQFSEWPFLRFLLPSFPLMFVGVAQVLRRVAGWTGPAGRLATAWVVLVLGMHRLDVARQRGALDSYRGERDAVELARHVRDVVPERGIVFSLIHSGSLRYYGGRVSARYDQMPSDTLDAAVSWLSEQGVRSYALLEPWEIPAFASHFSGQQAIARLADTPLLEYTGEHVVRLFDLTPGGASPAAHAPSRVERRKRAAGDLRSVPPVAPPALDSPVGLPASASTR